ncbi:MAG: transcriptional regulator [Syntrophomonadaceae bacterium]|jgi:hypothetical protein|nr:transcriptional regulator [Bacillota bacterium]NLM89100.1 transcriptional regulator [Syntrophomonadaceae bacterium]HQA49846.1 transcriptional regulator [Syntrophomonadaceae bacterium]HQD90708.1 transcriptional regulator [Syntrophomonadaceae bacterium]
MEFYRIQDKMISWQKIEKTLKKALNMRVRGFSQQEVADRLQIDRTFVSRLEGIGELRKGQTIAFVGFPIANKDEIQQLLESEGCDFILIMNEQERLDFINQRNGKQMLDDLMDLTAQVRSYDTVICVGSDQRVKLIEGVLDNQVISVEIGSSPITEDKWVDPQQIRQILRSIKIARG